MVGPAFNALLAQLHAALPLPGGATLRVNPNNSPGLLMAALVLLQLVALLTLLPEPPPYTSDPAAPPGRKCDAAKGVLRELRSLPVLACFTATFTFNLTIATSEALVVPVTKAAFGFSALQNSFVYLAIAVLMIGLNLAVMRVSRHPLAPIRALRKRLLDAAAEGHAAEARRDVWPRGGREEAERRPRCGRGAPQPQGQAPGSSFKVVHSPGTSTRGL